MDNGGGDRNHQEATQTSSSSHRNLYCEGCGGDDFYSDDDHYYCSECRSQSQDLIHTATSDEDLLSDGSLYRISYARSYSQSQNPFFKARLYQQLEHVRALHAHADDSTPVKFAGFDVDEVSEPGEFGSGSCSDKEKVADEIRARYVEGLQAMVQGKYEPSARLWDEKQEDDSAGEAMRPRTSVINNDSLDPNKGKEDDEGRATPMEEDIAAENLPKEPLNREDKA